MKVVIMADSLALPRPESDGNIPYEATYPFLLDQSLRRRLGPGAPQIIERGMRSRTIERVVDDWLELVELRRPEVVVVHVGIVDCAPRVFLRRERSLVERLRPARVRVRLLNFVHRHRRRIISLRPRVYVPPERFESLVAEVVRRAGECRVRSLVFVNIIMPSEQMEQRSPGFRQNAELYNRLLAEQSRPPWVRLIDLNELVWQSGGPDALTFDGIHINEAGHRVLAAELERHVNALLEDQPGAGREDGPGLSAS